MSVHDQEIEPEEGAETTAVTSGVPMGLSTERLSLILAICAILVSLASFYATYLQADSAKKQVKAMTLPLLQFHHGNYDEQDDKQRLTFGLKNAGVGPAIIKSVMLKYKGTQYGSRAEFFAACCGAEWDQYRAEIQDKQSVDRSMLSRPLLNAVIPGQSEYRFLALDLQEETEAFWWRLNEERWSVELDLCFCSLLDECYVTGDGATFTAVDRCRAPGD